MSRVLALVTSTGVPRAVLAHADAQGRVFAFDPNQSRAPAGTEEDWGDGVGEYTQLTSAADYAQIKRDLDALEGRALRNLGRVLEDSRDAVYARVRRSKKLADLVRDLTVLPRARLLRGFARDLLQSAWEDGGKAARREVREGRRAVREMTFNPNQPRAPAGTEEGGQWASSSAGKAVVYHGTVDSVIARIRREGLLPIRMSEEEGSKRRAVFVTNDLAQAREFAKRARGSRGGRGVPVVLELRIPRGIWEKEFKTDVKIGKAHAKYRVGRLPPEFISGGVKVSGERLFALDGSVGELVEIAFAIVLVEEEAQYTEQDDYADPASVTPRAALRWLNEKADFFVSGITGKLVFEIKNVLLNSMKTGATLEETITRLGEVFLPYLGDPNVVRDEEQFQPYRLETIIRTNTTEAYNQGRLSEYLDSDLAPFLLGVRYSAIIDSRTTPVCNYLDQKIFRVTDPDLQSLVPPNHWNCRSVIEPVVLGQTVDVSEFITEAEKGEAKGLADAKFLSQHGVWGAYRESVEEYAIDAEGNSGVWKTIRGRRVFIRDDESMQAALKRSLNRKVEAVDKKKIEAALQEVESNAAYAAKKESGWIISPGGKVLNKFSGEKDYVEVPQRSEHLLRDAVFTHNHPNGSSFSRTDLMFAASTDVREMRAFGTKDGTKVQYSLTRPKGGWPDGFKLGDAYTSELGRAKQRWFPKVLAGKITREDAYERAHEEILSKAAQRYGIGYTRRELK